MKYIKLLLLNIAVFLLLFTIIGLLFPSTSRAVKAVVINKPQQEVFTELKITEKWMAWYPFFNNTGSAIQNAIDDTTIFYNDKKEWRIYNKKYDSNTVAFTIKGFNGNTTDQSIMVLPITGDSTQTQVMWSETEHIKWYPWERFRGLVLENTRGVYLDTILNRFKMYIESNN
jgi:hypothetical protein